MSNFNLTNKSSIVRIFIYDFARCCSLMVELNNWYWAIRKRRHLISHITVIIRWIEFMDSGMILTICYESLIPELQHQRRLFFIFDDWIIWDWAMRLTLTDEWTSTTCFSFLVNRTWDISERARINVANVHAAGPVICWTQYANLLGIPFS
jgi:hypothetical protein